MNRFFNHPGRLTHFRRNGNEGGVSSAFHHHRRSHMFRLVCSALALAGILATTQPTLAESRAPATSDSAQSPAPTKQAVPPLPVSSPTAPPSSGLGEDMIPVGFGWG
jgi:hypothetical protein